MSSLISVIVPVYNTEQYLDRCVQSILKQSYQNLEIILIDDGSTDESSKKCDLFAQKDHRIRVIHKQNGGQSSARNAGLDNCNGDYISFVDSDDWIEPDMYTMLVDQLEKYDVGLVICGRYDVFEKSNQKIGRYLGKSGIFDARQIFPQMIIGQTSDFSVCDKLYRKDLWVDIRFPEGEIYEDLAIMYKVVLAAKTVVLLDVPFYIYFHRKNSTTTSNFKESMADYPKQTKQLLADVTCWCPECINYAIWSHIKAIQVVLIKLLKSDRKTFCKYGYLYRNYIQEIKTYEPIWKKDSLFTLKDRVICMILMYKRIARCLLLIKNRKSM